VAYRSEDAIPGYPHLNWKSSSYISCECRVREFNTVTIENTIVGLGYVPNRLQRILREDA
jgi:hypothetical protein